MRGKATWLAVPIVLVVVALVLISSRSDDANPEHTLEHPAVDDATARADVESRYHALKLVADRQERYLHRLRTIQADRESQVKSAARPSCPSPRLAIATMTRHLPPYDLEFWLDYHFSVGFCQVFLRIQHSQELRYIVSLPKYKDRVFPVWMDDWDLLKEEHIEDEDGKKHAEMTKRDWQTDFVDSVCEVIESFGIDWLFHFDDDELFYMYGRDIPSYFANVSSDVHDVHWKNFESLVVDPSKKRYPPFDPSKSVAVGGDESSTSPSYSSVQAGPPPDPRNAVHRYTNRIFYKSGKHAYGNGKSSGRVSSEKLHTHGVHFFRTRRQYNDDIRLKPEKEVGVILHHESPSFMGWATKFTNFREFDLKHNPMTFNKQSVEKISKAYEWYLDNVSTRSEDLRDKIDSSHTLKVRLNIIGHDDSFYEAVPQSYKDNRFYNLTNVSPNTKEGSEFYHRDVRSGS